MVGPKQSFTGDTICDPEQNPIALENIFRFGQDPAGARAKTKSDQDKLAIALQESSQRGRSNLPCSAPMRKPARTIIAGMGELHLEVMVACAASIKLRLTKPRWFISASRRVPSEV